MRLFKRSHAKNFAASPQTSVRLNAPWCLFWAGLLARVAYITLARSYRFQPIHNHFEFGWEVGRIARALATGYGFADPFVGHTGPTAWVPPLYPLILAGVFKVFGVYTLKSGWVLLTVNSVFSAATALAVYEIAARCFDSYGFGKSVARWSGWFWALYPGAMQFAVRWIWEMSLTTMLFAWVLVLALRVRGIGEQKTSEAPSTESTQTTRRWLSFGLLWGLIALSNSTLLLFLPVCGIWMLRGAPDKGAAFGRAVLAGILFLCILTPWEWRNWTVFHRFVPIRGNLGAELYFANLPGAQGFPWGTLLPLAERAPEIVRYKHMGEAAYVKEKGELAKAYIRSHRKKYALVTLERFYFFWAGVPHPNDKAPILEVIRTWSYCFISLSGLFGLGLALKRRVPAAGLFAWAFLLLPLTYYLVTVGARFRHSLEPLILIFSIYLFQSASPRKAKVAAQRVN